MKSLNCRFCKKQLSETFINLGLSPVANALVPSNTPEVPEMFYPLHVYICSSCLLVQLPNTVSRTEIFNDKYTYYSSFSASWLQHAKSYVDMITNRLSLSQSSFVIELASNDGYLLKNFLDKNIPSLGIDPSANVAIEAKKYGVNTLIDFFGVELANKLRKQNKQADLIIANNVMAHVPDINDFVSGIATLLKSNGVLTAEFPYIVNLIEKNQFDTIYHEHYSYYSLSSIEKILDTHGLTLFDIEELPTHGGSLRIYAGLSDSAPKRSEKLRELKNREVKKGFAALSGYTKYQEKVAETKYNFLEFIIKLKKEAKSIIAYGAAAKGNTFLNFCGVKTDIIDYVVDDSPFKQGHLLAGTRIPVYPSYKIAQTRPDYALILTWNLKAEILQKLSVMKKWGGSYIVAIPQLEFGLV